MNIISDNYNDSWIYETDGVFKGYKMSSKAD